jgi:hypothetical protein
LAKDYCPVEVYPALRRRGQGRAVIVFIRA